MSSYRYAAFISYSRKDKPFAKRLHAFLEHYRIPNSLGEFKIGDKKNRLSPVFCDFEELPAGSLDDNIKSALASSYSLIVICSPNALKSHWVKEEIAYYQESTGGARVFGILEPSVGIDYQRPYEILDQLRPLRDAPADVLVADSRREGDGFWRAALMIVSGIVGVSLGKLINRERRRRRARLLSGSIAAVLALCAVALFRDVSLARDWANFAGTKTYAGYPVEGAAFAVRALPSRTDVRRFFAPANGRNEIQSAGYLNKVLLQNTTVGVADKHLLSRDGRRFFTLSDDGAGRLWDVDAGKLLAKVDDVKAYLFSRDQKILILQNYEEDVIFLNSNDGTIKKNFVGFGASFAYNESGDIIIMNSHRDGCVGIGVSSGMKVMTLRLPVICSSVTIHPESSVFLARTQDGSAVIMDLSANSYSGFSCEYCDFDSDGAYLYMTNGRNIKVMKWRIQKIMARKSMDSYIDAVRYSESGKSIFVKDAAGDISVLNTENGKEIGSFKAGDYDRYFFDNSYAHLIIREQDMFYVYALDTMKQIFSGEDRQIDNHFVSSKNGRTFVINGESLDVFRGEDGRKIGTIPSKASRWDSVTVSNSGRYVAVAGEKIGYIYEIDHDRLRLVVSDIKDNGPNGKFSEDESIYASQSYDNSVAIWDLKKKVRITQLGGDNTATEFDLSNDGRRAVAVNPSSEFIVFDFGKFRPLNVDNVSREDICKLNASAFVAIDPADQKTYGLTDFDGNVCNWQGLAGVKGLEQYLGRLTREVGRLRPKH